MTTQAKLVDAIRQRLDEIERERDHLVALLAQYNSGAGDPKVVATSSQVTIVRRDSTPFTARPNGPTERIVAVLRAHPGLRYAEIIAQATKGMDTHAGKPGRSVGSTLSSLAKRGKVVRKEGRYYLAENGQFVL